MIIVRVDVAARESRGRVAMALFNDHERRLLDPRHVRRHVTTLPGDLRRRLFAMPARTCSPTSA